MRPSAVLLASIVVAPVGLGAMDRMTDPQSIRDAVAIGQSSIASERARFQQGYRVNVAVPPVDYLEIITPFRRIELAAESRALAGDRTFGEKQGRDTLADSNRLDVNVELTFHPLNTFVGVPDYSVRLQPVGGGDAIDAIGTERVPRFGARIEGRATPIPAPTTPTRKGPGEPVLGGTLIAHFDSAAIDPAGTYDVVINDQPSGRARSTELARARVDFTRLR